MATMLTSLQAKLLATKVFNDAFNVGWAVFADFALEDMTWRIYKVEPWDSSKHKESMRYILRIEDARDELEAYTTALKILEEQTKCV